MKIEHREITEVKPYANNPRDNDPAVATVARSIEAFGWRQPIVVDEDGVIVCGHTRWKAAKSLGIDKVPVHVAKDLTPEQIKAYRIADNKSASMSDWDYDLLPLEFAELQQMDIDPELTGFTLEEIQALHAQEGTEGLTDPDEVPEPPEDPTTQPGDLWILGNHRLLCGDSTNEAHVDRLLDGAKIHLVNTDPPYNVKLEPRSNNAIASSGKKHTHHQGLDVARHPEKEKATHTQMRARDRQLVNDYVSDEEFQQLLRAWFGNMARVMEPGRGFYIWGGYANCANYPPALEACKLYFSQAIIWVKQHPVMTRKDFMGNHEWCFYGWKQGAAHYFNPEIHNATDVWEVKKVNPQHMVHLTEKPVELATRAMTYSSVAGENVLDLFGGSGSTLIGAEKMGRNAYLMEIDPPYCDVIIQRWSEFTGRKAERIPANGNEQ